MQYTYIVLIAAVWVRRHSVGSLLAHETVSLLKGTYLTSSHLALSWSATVLTASRSHVHQMVRA